jgi:hypothetical protein
MRMGLLITTLMLSGSAFAEYRAYQYLVKTTDPYATATKADSRYIVSSMNPENYRRFHGGSLVTIDLLRTWICPGYTGRGTTPCDHPYDKGQQ